MWLTADQQWAIRTCVEAGLELRTNEGAVFIGGDVGPFTPYIPQRRLPVTRSGLSAVRPSP